MLTKLWCSLIQCRVWDIKQFDATHMLSRLCLNCSSLHRAAHLSARARTDYSKVVIRFRLNHQPAFVETVGVQQVSMPESCVCFGWYVFCGFRPAAEGPLFCSGAIFLLLASARTKNANSVVHSSSLLQASKNLLRGAFFLTYFLLSFRNRAVSFLPSLH